MSKEEHDLLVKKLKEDFSHYYSRVKNQNSTIKVFLKNDQGKDRIIESMRNKITKMFPFLEVKPSDRIGNVIYIIKIAGKKTVARDYVLNDLRSTSLTAIAIHN